MKCLNYLILLMHLCLSICSCHNSTKVSGKSSGTFIRDLPSDGMGKNSVFSSLSLIRDSLKLDTLENGYDSLQIRIWLYYSLTYRSQLLVIKNKDKKWEGTFYEIAPRYIHSSDTLSRMESVIENKRPKRTWEEFIEELYSYQILTLPDSDKLHSYNTPNDPNGVIIEISSKNKYRLYQYASPGHSVERFPEAKNIEKILTLVQNELGIKILQKI